MKNQIRLVFICDNMFNWLKTRCTLISAIVWNRQQKIQQLMRYLIYSSAMSAQNLLLYMKILRYICLVFTQHFVSGGAICRLCAKKTFFLIYNSEKQKRCAKYSWILIMSRLFIKCIRRKTITWFSKAYITPFHDLKLVLKKYFGLFQNITINVMLKTGTNLTCY